VLRVVDGAVGLTCGVSRRRDEEQGAEAKGAFHRQRL